MTDEKLPTLEEIRAVIANRPRSLKLKDIAKAQQVSISFLKEVLSGKTTDPSYPRLASVYEYVRNYKNA